MANGKKKKKYGDQYYQDTDLGSSTHNVETTWDQDYYGGADFYQRNSERTRTYDPKSNVYTKIADAWSGQSLAPNLNLGKGPNELTLGESGALVQPKASLLPNGEQQGAAVAPNVGESMVLGSDPMSYTGSMQSVYGDVVKDGKVTDEAKIAANKFAPPADKKTFFTDTDDELLDHGGGGEDFTTIEEKKAAASKLKELKKVESTVVPPVTTKVDGLLTDAQKEQMSLQFPDLDYSALDPQNRSLLMNIMQNKGKGTWTLSNVENILNDLTRSTGYKGSGRRAMELDAAKELLYKTLVNADPGNAQVYAGYLGYNPNTVKLVDKEVISDVTGNIVTTSTGLVDMQRVLSTAMQDAAGGDMSGLVEAVGQTLHLPDGYTVMTDPNTGLPRVQHETHVMVQDPNDPTKTIQQLSPHPRKSAAEEQQLNDILLLQQQGQALVTEQIQSKIGLNIDKERLGMVSEEFRQNMNLALDQHQLQVDQFQSNEALSEASITGIFKGQPTMDNRQLMAQLSGQIQMGVMTDAGVTVPIMADTVEMQKMRAELTGQFAGKDTISAQEFKAAVSGYLDGKPTFARDQWEASQASARDQFLLSAGKTVVRGLMDEKGNLTEEGQALKDSGIDVQNGIAVLQTLDAQRADLDKQLMEAKATGLMTVMKYVEQPDGTTVGVPTSMETLEQQRFAIDRDRNTQLIAMETAAETHRQTMAESQQRIEEGRLGVQQAQVQQLTDETAMRRGRNYGGIQTWEEDLARSANVRAGEQQTFEQEFARDRMQMEKEIASREMKGWVGDERTIAGQQIDEAQRAAMAGEVTARQAITEQTERLAMELQAQAAQQGQQLSAEQAMQQAQLQMQQQMQQTAGQQTIAQQTLQGQQAIAQQQLGGQQQLAAIGAQGTQDRQQLAMQIQAQAQQQGQQITAQAALAEADRQLQSQMQTTAGTQAIEQIQAQATAQQGMQESMMAQARTGLEQMGSPVQQTRNYTRQLNQALGSANINNTRAIEFALNQALPPVPAGMVWDTASGALKFRAGYEGRDIDPETQRAMELVAPALRARDRAERVLTKMQDYKMEIDAANMQQANEDKRLRDALADGDIMTAEEAAYNKQVADTKLVESQTRTQQYQMVMQLISSGPVALGLAQRSGILAQLQSELGIEIPHVPQAPSDAAAVPTVNEWNTLNSEERSLRMALFSQETGMGQEDFMNMIRQNAPAQMRQTQYATL